VNGLAGRITALLLGSALLLAIPAAASAEAAALLREGEGLARSGRCDQAIPVLERARAADPADAVVLHVLGQCQIRLANYSSAAATLAAARQLDPDLPEIDLQLGIARFHSEDLDGAEAAFAEARRREGSGASAELDLYEGLIQLERSQPAQAAESLERARQLNPRLVEPIASYYAGVAWMTADDEARARVALERVIREAPGTQWADAAQRILDDPAGPRGTAGIRDRRDLDGEEQAERPLGSMAELHRPDRWLLLSGGLEWDSNVVLRGKGVELPTNISDEEDGRGVWSTQAGMQFVDTEDWTVGVLAAYYGTAYFNENDFNVHYPSISPWVDWRVGDNTVLRLQYDFSYAWVGGDSFLLSNGIVPALYHNWGEAGTSRFQADIFYDDYKYDRFSAPQGAPGGVPGDDCPSVDDPFCGPFGLDIEEELNADGLGAFFGPSHSIGADKIDTEFYAGYRFLYYESKGTEYSYRGHEFQLGSRTLLPYEFWLDLRARYVYKPFQHSSVLPIPGTVEDGKQFAIPSSDRRDHVFEIVGIIERQITKNLFGSIRCNYLKNDSNTAVYDYDRILVGGFLTVRFFN